MIKIGDRCTFIALDGTRHEVLVIAAEVQSSTRKLIVVDDDGKVWVTHEGYLAEPAAE